MYMTNVTMLRRNRGLTDVTPYDILEAVLGVHGQASSSLLLERLKNQQQQKSSCTVCQRMSASDVKSNMAVTAV